MNKNQFMYICPNCQEAYSSDTVSYKRCPNCGNDLVMMNLTPEDWRQLDDTQKQIYKDRYYKPVNERKEVKSLDKAIRIISYSVFHFFLGGFYILRENEIPYFLLVIVVSFSLFWWKRPSLEEWKENCVNRKWLYLIGGIMFGLNGITLQPTVTNTVGLYTYSYSNWPEKITHLFYSVLLLCKWYYSIRFSKELNINQTMGNSNNVTLSSSLNNNSIISKKSQSIDEMLLEFDKRIFPNNCRSHIKKQMRSIAGNTTTDEENIKIYIYCMTHYLVNGEKIDYVTKMLPVAHPEIKDPDIASKIAEYTLTCAVGDPSKIDITNKADNEAIKTLGDAFRQQELTRQANVDKNKMPFDITRGTVREKPMYFKGARAAENYLNSLKDLEGNPLHFGMRFSYSVEGIPDMLDAYRMLRKDGSEYGYLFLSIYGMDNYQYVPEGYLHPTLKNPIIEKKEDDISDSVKEKSKTKTKTGSKKSNKKDDTVETASTSKKSNTKTVDKEKQTKKAESEEKKSRKTTKKTSTKTNVNVTDDNTLAKVPDKKEKEMIKSNQTYTSEPKRIRFCRKCGTELLEGSVFCRKCGTKVEG